MKQLQAWSLRIGGMLVLMIGAGHVWLPTRGYAPNAAATMSTAARDHFYYLGTYAICVFLLAFGVLALTASKETGTRGARTFSRIMTLVWAVRLYLELRYPVTLPIYAVVNPHPVLVATLCAVTTAFLVAAVSGQRLAPQLIQRASTQGT